MLFYEITVHNIISDLPNGKKRCNNNQMRTDAQKILEITENFNSHFHGDAFFVLVDVDGGNAVSLCICKSPYIFEKHISSFLSVISVKGKKIKTKETTLKDATDLLFTAKVNGFLENDDEILKAFDLIFPNHRILFGENLIPDLPKNIIYEKVKKTLYSRTMIPELDRIYSGGGKKKTFFGHPCHYMMLTVDENEVRKNTTRTLLSVLYTNNRLASKRYWYTNIDPTSMLKKKDLDRIFRTCIGGSIVIRYSPLGDGDNEGNHASVNREKIEIICDIIKKYRNETLAILCIPHNAPKIKMMFYEYLGSVNIVELKEEYAKGQVCRDYLKSLCREQGIRSDKKLIESIEENKCYSANELKIHFDEWYNKKLITVVYPQYSTITKAEKTAILTKDEGSAYGRLQELIGLDEVKKVITQIKDYFTAQRIFKDKGCSTDRPAMSMVFTGNPGSCKTTVARLVAEIFCECGILSEGKIVECGRGDLVGKYVGWTAQNIQKKFKEAQNSVLFIDEAYSLVDDCNGSFGDEAINTIVQEMENHRNDVLVIFAGYPDKMEDFLNKNPGLRSRITFHVHFADYTPDELCRISSLIAKQKGLTLSEEALEKLHGVYEKIVIQPDFGNGRTARNIIEAAKMSMASRLLKGNVDDLTEKDITTITAEDITEPVLTSFAKPHKRVIGF